MTSRLYITHVILLSIALSSCSKHSSTSPLAVEAMFPTSGPDSTQVSIGGTGFSATLANDLVSFNGKPATVLSATTTSLVVRTPTLAGTGEVTVSVGGKTINAGFFAYDTSWKGATITDTITTPEYLSIDASGNLYVSSFLNSMVYKITPGDSISPFAAIPFPYQSAFDASGNMYVVSNGESIVKVSPSGTVTPFVTSYYSISAVATDPSGNVYFVNQTNQAIDKISPQGIVSGYDSNAAFISSCGSLATNNGILYALASDKPGLTGSGVGIIYGITGTGITSTITSGFDYDGEAQLTFDKNNNLYVTDFNQGNLQGLVYRITPGGISSPLYLMSSISWIVGIAADSSGGHLYVTGFQNNQTTFAGSLTKLTMH